MMPIKKILSIGVCALQLISASSAQVKKTEALTAIREMSAYITDVLIDEEGKSRCDYNLTEGKWYPYEVPWHTGQAINALLAAYKQTGDPKYLATAKKAGNYWASLQIKDHPKLKGMLGATHGDFIGDETIVFATISDGSPGLYELSRVSKDPKYAAAATSAASWMLKNMYSPEAGVCYDNVDLKTGEVQKEHSAFWKDKNEQTLYDVSRPNIEGWLFKDAFEFSGRADFRDAFINLSNSALKLQSADGLWMQFTPNGADVKSYHPRFNLWYAEALIEAWKLTGDRKYLEGAARTARMFVKAQQKDGTIYYDNFIDGRGPDRSSITGSAVAFSGIVWLALSKAGYTEFDPAIEKAAQWVMSNRYDPSHPDKNLRGGVIETRARSRNNKIWLVNRDIGTSFSVRFLADYINSKG